MRVHATSEWGPVICEAGKSKAHNLLNIILPLPRMLAARPQDMAAGVIVSFGEAVTFVPTISFGEGANTNSCFHLRLAEE